MEVTSDVDILQAKQMIETGKSKIIWLGSEPVEYIAKLLDIEKDLIIKIDPNELLSNPDMPALLDGNIFMCYHGNSSRYVVNYLKNKKKQAYNLKGGITSIVGEIF